MPIQSANIDCSALEGREAAPLQKRFFNLWRASNGILDNSLVELGSHLVLMGGNGSEPVPRVLRMGKHSLAKRVMGTGWEQELLNINGHQAIAAGYKAAIDGEPVYQFIDYSHDQDASRAVCYERIILPFHTAKGFKVTATLSVTVSSDTLQSRDLLGRTGLIGISNPTSNPLPFSTVQPKSEARF